MQQPTRRQEFAAAIAAATGQPEWRLSREGWHGDADSTLILPRDAKRNSLLEQYCTAMDFIESLDIAHTIRPTGITSIDLKELYERVSSRAKRPGYASHGAFILAAISTGFADARPSGAQATSRLRISKDAWTLATTIMVYLADV